MELGSMNYFLEYIDSIDESDTQFTPRYLDAMNNGELGEIISKHFKKEYGELYGALHNVGTSKKVINTAPVGFRKEI